MVDLAEEPNTPIAFNQLPLSPETLNALNSIGYQHATPVQAGSIQPALEGKDLMVQSQTGTGKTAAFSLPLIERLKDEDCIGALILAPTRELARQVMQEAERLSSHVKDFSVTCIYGGVSFDEQVKILKQRPNIVVGTPGRVLDHLRRKTLQLTQLKCFVLDEADEMLSMGFAEELEDILKFVPKQRQTLFFSATFPANVKRYAKKTLNDPIALSFLGEASSADDLEHHYMMLPGVARHKHLRNLILELNPERAIIFTNTRKDADRTAQMLNKYGLEAHKLSGDMDQGLRDRVMKKMRDKKIRFLVATDVAARGIDISQLTHVFHYQLPDNPEVYIHRSGRTGRAGAKGVVYSLASSKDLSVIYALKRFHHLVLQERALPTTPVDLNLKKVVTKPSSPNVPKESLGDKTRSKKETHDQAEVKRAHKNKVSGPTSIKKNVKVTPPIRSEVKPDTEAKPKSSQTESRLAKHSGKRRGSSRRPKTSTARQLLEDLKQSQHLDTKKVIHLSREELEELAQCIIASDRATELMRVILQALQMSLKPVKPDFQNRVPKKGSSHTRVSKNVEALHPDKSSGQSPQLYINLGRKDLRGGHSAVKECIAELGGLLPEDIKQLTVEESKASFVVNAEFQDDLIAAINGEELAHKTLFVKLKT
ncbi:MAG: DEAD/DEAH box helicase [Myxococcales bacterium]|nr:DEAD/DEAH box helicase [Myxococcales bacterium]